jgi:hypothetical protein
VLADCFRHWDQAFAATNRQLTTAASTAERTEEIAARRQAAVDTARSLRQRMIQADVLPEDYQTPIVEVTIDEQQPSVQFVLSGDEIVLQCEAVSAGHAVPPRWLLAAIVALGTLALVILLRLQEAQNWLMAHWPFVLAAVGGIWWLVAPFGWLAVAAIAAAVWLAVRWPLSAAAYAAGPAYRGRTADSQ